MINVTAKQVMDGSGALKKLADNAKLPPVLFFKVLRVWKRVKDETESFQAAQQVALDKYQRWVDVPDGMGGTRKIGEFKSIEDKAAYLAEEKQLLAQTLELGVDVIKWEDVDQARKDKVLELTPAELGSLDWLIELPEE